MSAHSRKLATLLFLSVSWPLAFGASGCKQGAGEFCQVTLDCEDGLECNAGTQRCQAVGSGNTSSQDASPIQRFDASPPDASPPDASPPDASPPDASPPDASPPV